MSIEYKGKTFPDYNHPVKSDRKGKKKMVLVKHKDQVKLLHYGAEGYQNNYSDKAKASYLARAKGIRGKDGSLTADNPMSANYWAIRDLWPEGKPADGSDNWPVKVGKFFKKSLGF